MLTTRDPALKVLAFLALFVFPMAATVGGSYYHVERSKRTEFCLSCHTMDDHGRSLLIDDPNFLPAAHYQNNRVPRAQACYTCHTDYTMYGPLTAKLRGLRHVYVQYLGNPPKSADLKLYTPYNNRECLHCHLGARTFEEKSAHHRDESMMAAIKANQTSCLQSGCHDIVHDVELLNEVPVWSPAQ